MGNSAWLPISAFLLMFYLHQNVECHPLEEANTNNNDLASARYEHGEMKRSTPPLQVVPIDDWLDSIQPLGQITGVAIDSKGDLIFFHRASRVWDGSSFNRHNVFTMTNPIQEDVLVKVNTTTGQVIWQWGAGKFYLPMGLTIDHEDNIWLTDVAMHQVFKYPPGGSENPLITLGVKFVPASDIGYFCKPTDVAVMTNGDFFVSDGYCNSRVLKFNADGKLIMEINEQKFPAQSPPPHGFHIPHSMALDVKGKCLYVADRENGRVLVFQTKAGDYLDTYDGFGSRVYAIDYSPSQGGRLFIVNGQDGSNVLQGYTFNLATKQVTETWKPPNGFTSPSAVAYFNATTTSGEGVFVAEIGPNKIWKFQRK